MAYDRNIDLLDLVSDPSGEDEFLMVDRQGVNGRQVRVRARDILANTPFAPSFSLHPGLYNFKPSNLKRWRKALANVRAGTGGARIALPGDSTTAGLGAGTGASALDGARVKSWPYVLAKILNGQVPTNTNSIFGAAAQTDANYLLYDPRLALGAGWTNTGSIGILGGNAWMNSTTLNALSFTPAEAFDTIDVWHVQNAGHAVFTVDVDGGAALSTPTAHGAAAFVKKTITCPLGTHTINIKRVSGGVLYIAGIETSNSAERKVSIANMGVPSAVAASFANVSGAWTTANALGTFGADLGIINLGINNWTAGTDTAAFSASYQTVIDKVKLSGDAILMIPAPSSLSVGTAANQARITQAIYDLASANDCPVIDLTQRFSSQAEALADGYYYDTHHPNALGYADVGQLSATALMI